MASNLSNHNSHNRSIGSNHSNAFPPPPPPPPPQPQPPSASSAIVEPVLYVNDPSAISITALPSAQHAFRVAVDIDRRSEPTKWPHASTSTYATTSTTASLQPTLSSPFFYRPTSHHHHQNLSAPPPTVVHVGRSEHQLYYRPSPSPQRAPPFGWTSHNATNNSQHGQPHPSATFHHRSAFHRIPMQPPASISMQNGTGHHQPLPSMVITSITPPTASDGVAKSCASNLPEAVDDRQQRQPTTASENTAPDA